MQRQHFSPKIPDLCWCSILAITRAGGVVALTSSYAAYVIELFRKHLKLQHLSDLLWAKIIRGIIAGFTHIVNQSLNASSFGQTSAMKAAGSSMEGALQKATHWTENFPTCTFDLENKFCTACSFQIGALFSHCTVHTLSSHLPAIIKKLGVHCRILTLQPPFPGMGIVPPLNLLPIGLDCGLTVKTSLILAEY